MRRFCLIVIWLAAFSALARAQDVLVLKDGSRFSGTIEWESATHVGMKVDYGLIQFEKTQIEEILKAKPSDPRSSRARKGIMNLAGPPPEKGRTRIPAVRRAQDPSPPDATEQTDDPAAESVARTADSPTHRDPGHALLSPDLTFGQRVEKALATIKQRLGPFFPNDLSAKLAISVLLFLLGLGLVQIGCRFIDMESFSLTRGMLFNTVLCLALFGGYSVRGVLDGPLLVVLALLSGFVVLAAAASALFQERAGKSTMLVVFVLFAGGVCVTCITVGVIGVVNLN